MTEKRLFQRIPIKGQVKIFSDNVTYCCGLTNISEKGLFITTKEHFPIGKEVEVEVVHTYSDKEAIKFPIKVRRALKTDDSTRHPDNHGMGVEVINPPAHYLNFVSDLKVYYFF